MAGGMSTGGESLAQRVANTKATAERQIAPSKLQAFSGHDANPDAKPDVRHCWYDGPHGRQAALFLEWRVTAGAWRGRIAVAAPDSAGWVLVEQWVDSGMLTPR